MFLGESQIGFQCFANYTPDVRGKQRIMHFNRTVIHPDYVGLGLGIKLINETSKTMASRGFRVMGKFSSTPVYKSMIKSKEWHFLGVKRTMGKLQKGKTMNNAAGFREYGIKTYHFEFKNIKNDGKKSIAGKGETE